jgi:glyoxylase-like metal-dependent hydrolase (beta-lactamase superfamily II)
MADWENYTRGAHRISDHIWAYMQPNGSWGLNNMAVLARDGEALLIDTSSDIPLTRSAIEAFAAAAPDAAQIVKVILTHWHVDHVHGICAPELAGASIVASRIAADFMEKLPPPRWLESIAALTGEAREQITEYLGRKFDFSGLFYRAPDEVFEGSYACNHAGIAVDVIETKPSHTRSDSVVHISSEGVVHTGDLVASGRHVGIQFPFMSHLLDAVDLMIGFDARVYVPGHGPLLDLQDMKDIREYLLFLQGMARQCFDRGLSCDEANAHILSNLGLYSRLTGAHNLFFTIRMMYCEFAGDTEDHLRRDYPAFLAAQWRMKQHVTATYPQLYAPF